MCLIQWLCLPLNIPLASQAYCPVYRWPGRLCSHLWIHIEHRAMTESRPSCQKKKQPLREWMSENSPETFQGHPENSVCRSFRPWDQGADLSSLQAASKASFVISPHQINKSKLIPSLITTTEPHFLLVMFQFLWILSQRCPHLLCFP